MIMVWRGLIPLEVEFIASLKEEGWSHAGQRQPFLETVERVQGIHNEISLQKPGCADLVQPTRSCGSSVQTPRDFHVFNCWALLPALQDGFALLGNWLWSLF
jgi:hypothetical protein